MTNPRRFRPSAVPLEGRLALSFSLDGLVHSVLPFLGHDDHASASSAARPSSYVDTGPLTKAATPHAPAHPHHRPPFALRHHAARPHPPRS